MQNGNKEGPPAPTNAEQHTSQPPAEEAKEEKPDSQVGDKTEPKQEVEKPGAEDTKMTGAGDGEAKKEEDSQPAKKEPSEKKEDTEQVKTNGDAVDPGERGDDVSSSILEKGIIYFFFRPRVNVDEPQDVNDVARTYMVMRPIPLDAKLGDGPIGDAGNCRLLALPKKVLP